MNDDQSSSQDRDSKPQRSWLERLSQALQGGEPQDRTQLLELLRDAQHNNIIDIDALAMIEGVLQVSEMQVRDIMIPRSQMVVVERDATPESILPTVVGSAHSRFPVVGENRDEVIGILLAKDLLPYCVQQSDKLNIRDLLRPAVIIPESKRLNILLKEFRAYRNHMAIVVDEYGGVSGLVTIEDVLEQIVGEIEDEHDIADDIYIMDHGEHRSIIKAVTPIEAFNEHFSSDFSDEEYDTIGGLVTNAFGHLPKRGESVELGSFHFKVLRADNRRLYLLQVSRLSQGEASDTNGTGVGC